MERRPDLGFDSYDRFFPNQDEDLAKELDSVLDGMLRALSARRNAPTVIPIAAVRRSGA